MNTLKMFHYQPEPIKGDVQTAFVMAISQERKIQQEWFRNCGGVSEREEPTQEEQKQNYEDII